MAVLTSTLLCCVVILSVVNTAVTDSDFSTAQIRLPSPPRVCPLRKFQCRNKQCISGNRYCDGFEDCTDGSDERSCVCNLQNQFQCLNNRCIPLSDVCDGLFNCARGEDELHCGCPRGKFECRVDGWCIPARKVCDGYPNCIDRTDERPDACPHLAGGYGGNQISRFGDKDTTLQRLIAVLQDLQVARSESKVYDGLIESEGDRERR